MPGDGGPVAWSRRAAGLAQADASSLAASFAGQFVVTYLTRDSLAARVEVPGLSPSIRFGFRNGDAYYLWVERPSGDLVAIHRLTPRGQGFVFTARVGETGVPGVCTMDRM